jgi:N-ethylmaleimide reductase
MVVETARAVAEAIGAHRTGLRISPGNPFNDISEDGVEETYGALVESVDSVGLAYLHLLESSDRTLTNSLRKNFSGTFVLNPHTPERVTGEAELALIEDGTADIISFGALFLANPDLPARLAAGGPYNTPDPATFYGGDDRGYTDYPALAPA